MNNVILTKNSLHSVSGQDLHFHSQGVMSKVTQEGELLVNSITLDDLMAEYDLVPTALKMDIEGSEKNAVYGMLMSLETIKVIEAEMHSKEDYDSFKSVCRGFSLNTFSIDNMSSVYKFLIRHPIKVLQMEYHNNFHTTRRLLGQKEASNIREFPCIVFAYKE